MCASLLPFLQIIIQWILSGEHMHSTSKGIVPHTPVILIIVWKWSVHYASLTTNLHRSMNQGKAPLQSKKPLWKIWFPFCKGRYHVPPPNRHQRWMTLVSPRRMHFTCCGMPKGTSQAEAMLNSEKIKPAVLWTSTGCYCYD